MDRKDEPIRLVLYGGWAGLHIGDDAILEATINEIQRYCRELNKEVEITVLCSTMRETSAVLDTCGLKIFALKSSPRTFIRPYATRVVESKNIISRNLNRAVYILKEYQFRRQVAKVISAKTEANSELAIALRSIERADALILCGGGYMTSEMRLSWLYPSLEVIKAAHTLQTTCWITGQTIGPITSERDKRRAQVALASIRQFGLRDPRSLSILRDTCLVDQKKLEPESDIALLLGNSSASNREPRKLIAISLQPRSTKQLDLALLNRLSVEFATFEFVMLPHTPEDATYLHELATTWELRHRINILPIESPATKHLSILRECSLGIGTRFHFSVLCFGSSTPCIALLENLKTKGLYEDFEANDRLISLTPNSVDQIVKKAREVVEEQGKVSLQIEQRRESLAAKCGVVLRQCIDQAILERPK